MRGWAKGALGQGLPGLRHQTVWARSVASARDWKWLLYSAVASLECILPFEQKICYFHFATTRRQFIPLLSYSKDIHLPFAWGWNFSSHIQGIKGVAEIIHTRLFHPGCVCLVVLLHKVFRPKSILTYKRRAGNPLMHPPSSHDKNTARTAIPSSDDRAQSRFASLHWPDLETGHVCLPANLPTKSPFSRKHVPN